MAGRREGNMKTFKSWLCCALAVLVLGFAPEWSNSQQRTVILSTHILQEVVQICQKVVIINEGRVVVEDTIENLTREMSLEEVFMRAIGGAPGAEEAVA